MNRFVQWLRNLKTAQKLFLIIFLMASFLIIVGLVGFYFNEKANRTISKMYNNNLLPILYLNIIRTDSRANQANLHMLIYTQNPDQRKKYLDDITRRTREWQNLLAGYGKTSLDPYEKSNFDHLNGEKTKIINAQTKTIQYSITGQPERAINSYQHYSFLLDDFNNRLRDLAYYNQQIAYLEHEQSNEYVKRAREIISFAVLLALSITVPLGLLISRLITEPLTNLEDKVNKVAAGNLDVPPIQVISRDEIGSLSKSFNKMTGNISNLINREKFLRDTVNTIRQTLDIDKTLYIISQEIIKLFNVERVLFTEYPNINDLKQYSIRLDYNNSSNMPDSKKIRLDPLGPEQWADITIKKGRTLIINDIDKSDVPDSLKHNIERLGIKAITGIPIRKEKEIWGTLSIATSYPRHWTEDEIYLLDTISDQIYLAIRQAQLYSTTKDLANRESILRSIINEVLMSESLEEIVDRTSHEINNVFNSDRVTVRLYDPSQDKFTQAIGEYKKGENIPTIIGKGAYPHEIDEYLIKKLFQEKENIVIDDINDHKYKEIYNPFLPETLSHFDVKATIGVPLIYKDTPLGVLYITNTTAPKYWEKKETDLATDIGKQMSVGLYLFDLNNKLNKSLKSERVVMDIILSSRGKETHDEIFDPMMPKLAELFNAQRIIHLHYNDNCALQVENEFITDKNLPLLINKILLKPESSEELFLSATEHMVVINDVYRGINNETLKDCLIENKILSFMLYTNTTPKIMGNSPAVTMVCSSTSRIWLTPEIDSFKLAVDTAAIIFLEIEQRKETEDTRNTFLATLTHDLRSPINAEQKALEYILSRNPDTQLSSFAEFLTDIYQTNEELLRIVNNILTVYHYESGMFELNLVPINLENIINRAIRSMTPLAEDAQSKISADIQSLPEILADENEITRVIINLINNAIKHNKKGTTINVSAKRENDKIIISVSDNGSGIPESEKPKIFQRYPTTKRKIGTGLGLYLSKQIIDAHKGKIWFESELNQGTTFSFSLPININKDHDSK